jgi:hypothetical protein
MDCLVGAGTLAMRAPLIGLYERAGRHIHAPALFHAVDNLCWQGQTSLGLEFEPGTHALLMAAIALGVTVTARPQRA